MKKNKQIRIFIILAGLLVFAACAQQGAPTGGLEDKDPPVVLKAAPKNYSVNFNAKKILITFDEYLDMANFTQELVVSPPMAEKPIVKLRNKTLIIELEEDLKPDVTYTFNFGEGIKDLNEKNVLLNYEYVFSTGDFLDSLSIKGKLRNAFDLSIPETPIAIMLYTELSDSIPLLEIPYYVGRTDKTGDFAVNNLKTGVYKMFVLKDGNNNFLFDLPNEEIAFLDTSIVVDAEYYRNYLLKSGIYDSTDLESDSLILTTDTTGMSADSIVMLLDSLRKEMPNFNAINLNLYMFTEDPVNQFISDYNRDKRRFLELVFNIPVSDSFTYKPIIPDSLEIKDLIPEFGKKRDSLTLWLGDTLIAAIDTIGIQMQYTTLDSLGEPIRINDTLQFVFREKTSKKKSDKNKKVKSNTLKISTIANSANHNILKDIVFTLESPVKSIDPSLFEMYIIPDSTEVPVRVTPHLDTANLRRVRLSNQWQEEASYHMILYPGAIKDIYGSENDTIDRKFNIKPLSEYGKINLTLDNIRSTILIEIYRKNILYESKAVSESGLYVFDFLEPDTYRVKFVYDRNANGKWDTGKYIKHLQAERVEFLTKDIKVRANWDHDVSYTMGTNDEPPGSSEEKSPKDKGAVNSGKNLM